MIGTYVAVLAVCVSSLALGQAAIALCGARHWSWLSPAVGLALLCAVCWGTVRLGRRRRGRDRRAAARGRVRRLSPGTGGGRGEALRTGWPVALIALLAASLPFAVEGHFGILGTSFNPDMSQHLLAADRLAHGQGWQLLHQGYPLGPHAIVVALNKGLGIGLVQGFSGLSVAVAVLAPLTALAAFDELRPVPRTAAALVVGLAYVVASYFAQGAFKETMQALFVLAFVLALRESTRTWRDLPLRFVPAALIAVGSVYVYSFPGLIWLLDRRHLGALELAISRMRLEVAPWGGGPRTEPVCPARRTPPPRGPRLAPRPSGVLVFAVLVAPELGRMIDFHSFETFDPNGPGLGNLFGQVSPFEALGIWPSGDFRLAPGDGAVPAVGYYLGAAFALVLLLYGIARCWRRRESRDPRRPRRGGRLAYAAARVGGTPYTAAKAIEIAAPLVASTILLPLLRCARRARCRGWHRGGPMPEEALATAGHGGSPAVTGPAGTWLAAAFALAAGACSLLALANAPVGPTSYSPALTRLPPADRRRLDPRPRPRPAARRPARHSLHRLGAARRPGLHRSRVAKRGERPPHGVRFVVTAAAPDAPPFRASGSAAPPPLRPLGSDRAGRRREPVPADRRTPGTPGPAR